MKRKFVTNLALLLLLNILIKPFYIFGIDRVVQNTVGEEVYGFYYSLLKFAFLLQIVLDFGIENFTRREIARHHQMLGKYLSNFIALKILLGSFYIILCIVLGFLVGYSYEQFRLLIILLFNQFLAGFILYFRANLGGLHLFKIDSLISVTDRFIMIVICGFLLLNDALRMNFKIEWFVYSQTFAYLITLALSATIVIMKTDHFSFRFDRIYYLSLLKKSFPYALLILLMSAYMHLDPVLLERIHPEGKIQAGIFAQSSRILEALANYGFLFSIILLPMFSRMIKQRESVIQLVKLSYLLIIVPSIIVTISCAVYRKEIIDVLYAQHLASSSKVFGILIFSFIFMCTTYIFGTLLTANGNLKMLNIMALVGVGLNFSLNLFLIPKYDAMGSAIANISTQFYAALVQIILSVKIFKLKVNYKLLSMVFAFTLGVFGIAKFYSFLSIPWYYGFFLVIITGTLLAVVTRLLNIRDLFSIIRYRELED